MNDARVEREPGETAELWRLWSALHRLFPTWALIPESFVTPGAWGYMGLDFLSGFRRNPSTLKAFTLLGDVSDELFDGLTAMAALNARRQDQLLRVVIVGYLTVPLSILALVAELAGASLMTFVKAHQNITLWIALTLAAAPLGYMMSAWRAKQLIGVLDLIRIERQQRPYTALELRDE
ncbi:hypothetical protein [Caulobacter segnis]|uniref:hypothetical protein n=1 Tax=Caulobacter segnis TaxID=88688 RepID=UPI00285EB23F|nr:hypothetical protein [Caulobacter segnis]MDR6624103.1 hypothetical protein [Caulobacter segnis]